MKILIERNGEQFILVTKHDDYDVETLMDHCLNLLHVAGFECSGEEEEGYEGFN